MMSDVLIWVI